MEHTFFFINGTVGNYGKIGKYLVKATTPESLKTAVQKKIERTVCKCGDTREDKQTTISQGKG